MSRVFFSLTTAARRASEEARTCRAARKEPRARRGRVCVAGAPGLERQTIAFAMGCYDDVSGC